MLKLSGINPMVRSIATVMLVIGALVVSTAPHNVAAASPAPVYTKMVIFPGNGHTGPVSSGVSQTNAYTYSTAPAVIKISNDNNQPVSTLTEVPQDKQVPSDCTVYPTKSAPIDNCSLWWEQIPHGELQYARAEMPQFYWSPTGQKLLASIYADSFYALSNDELTPACLYWKVNGTFDYAVLTNGYWHTASLAACEDAK